MNPTREAMLFGRASRHDFTTPGWKPGVEAQTDTP
jgi:hypothetical protein